LFRVAPIRDDLFSRHIIDIIGNGYDLGQVVAEVDLVSHANKGGSLWEGMKRSVVGMVEGIYYIIRHPLLTIKGLATAAWKGSVAVVNKPSCVVSAPKEAFNNHIDALDKKLADSYGVVVTDVRLPETRAVLIQNHKWAIAGEAGVEIASILIPAGKLGKAKYAGELAETKYIARISEASKTAREADIVVKAGKDASKFVKETKTAEKIAEAERKVVPISKTREVGATVDGEIRPEPKILKEASDVKDPKSHPDELRISRDTIAKEGTPAEKSALNKKAMKDGPEDQAFDHDKNKHSNEKGEQVYEEGAFQSGNDGVGGRKPTPDGVTCDGNTKIYWEDKRPSECKPGGNSWLSTYEDDPIKGVRTKAADDLKKKLITKDEAEAKIIIAENDDHFAKKGGRWNDPKEIASVKNEKLGIRMPDTEENAGRVEALRKELEASGRNPIVTRNNGVVSIVYDTPKV
jgi:hypothetical protein